MSNITATTPSTNTTTSPPSSPYIEVVSTNPFTQKMNESGGVVSPLPNNMHPRSMSTPYTPDNRDPNRQLQRRNTSFLDMDDDSLYSVSLLDQFDSDEPQKKYTGCTWNELVDRLLAAPMSKADANYRKVFLCLYRRIATPRDLLDRILEKYEQIEVDQRSPLLQKNDQLRYCLILHDWTTSYPGDFAHTTTRKIFKNFINTLSTERIFAGLAKDIKNILQKNVEDEDLSWGRSDTDENRMSLHSFISVDSTETITSDDSFKETSGDVDSVGETKSTPSSSPNVSSSGLASMQSLLEPLSQQTSHQSSSTTPQPIVRDQYLAFMDIPDNEIANELTRMDWVLFKKIKPRDFVRHVSVSAGEKEKILSLKHINQMIRHFNHVAYWVTNIILDRQKPKHRAKALEKFINIAWVR